jgi:hypothetical protein
LVFKNSGHLFLPRKTVLTKLRREYSKNGLNCLQVFYSFSKLQGYQHKALFHISSMTATACAIPTLMHLNINMSREINFDNTFSLIAG